VAKFTQSISFDRRLWRQDILGSIDGISFVRFGHEDVVRHRLVQRIVEAYKLHAEETGTQRRR